MNGSFRRIDFLGEKNAFKLIIRKNSDQIERCVCGERGGRGTHELPKKCLQFYVITI